MSTIDDLLERAAIDTRDRLAGGSRVPISTIRRRARRRSGVNVAAGVLGAGGALATVWVVTTRDSDQIPASPPPMSSVPVDHGMNATMSLETIPLLGIDLPGWTVMEAGESDEPNGHPSRWISYVRVAADGQGHAGAALNLFVIPVGSPEERSLMVPALELERIRVADRDVGRYSNQLANAFVFTWRESDTVVATLTVFGVEGAGERVTRTEAIGVIEALAPLTAGQWADALRADGIPERAPIAVVTTGAD